MLFMLFVGLVLLITWPVGGDTTPPNPLTREESYYKILHSPSQVQMWSLSEIPPPLNVGNEFSRGAEFLPLVFSLATLRGKIHLMLSL